MAHMHHMLAATTAALGCSRTAGVQTVTITPLPTVPATTADSPPPPPPPPTATATVVADPPPPQPDPSGYLVVDMLPAPARCLGLAAAARVTGSFHRAGGAVVLDLVVTLPGSGKLAGTTFTGTASAWSGRVVSARYQHRGAVAVVRIEPAPSAAGSVGVSFGVHCGAAGNGSLGVTASFSGAPADGLIPSLSLQDY
jgi:hypothetical protein